MRILDENLNESREVWNSNGDYNYWSYEATDNEVLDYFGYTEEDIEEQGLDVDELRYEICSDCDGDGEEDDLVSNILPMIDKQSGGVIIGIDGRDWDNLFADAEDIKEYMYEGIYKKWWEDATLYVDDNGNLSACGLDLYTLPRREDKLFKFIKNCTNCYERSKDPEERSYYDDNLSRNEVALKIFYDDASDQGLFEDMITVDADTLKQYLVPIKWQM